MTNNSEYAPYLLIGLVLLTIITLVRWGVKYRNCCEVLKERNAKLSSELAATSLLLAHVLQHSEDHQVKFLGASLDPEDMQLGVYFHVGENLVRVNAWQGHDEVFMGIKPDNAAYPLMQNLGVDNPTTVVDFEHVSIDHAALLYAPMWADRHIYTTASQFSIDHLNKLREHGIDPVRNS